MGGWIVLGIVAFGLAWLIDQIASGQVTVSGEIPIVKDGVDLFTGEPIWGSSPEESVYMPGMSSLFDIGDTTAYGVTYGQTRNPLVAAANAWVGKPYQPNRTGPYCADFVSCILHGGDINKVVSTERWVPNLEIGRKRIGLGDIKPGDILVFDIPTSQGNTDTHTGIYVGGYEFVHKGSGNTVTRENLSDWLDYNPRGYR